VYSGGSGSASLPQSTPIEDLAADSDHHFRIVALRAGIAVAGGADQTLHTTGPPATEPPAEPPGTTPGPPETTIDSGPAKLKQGRNATFSFSSDQAGSSFDCRVDGKEFAACSSPHAVKRPRRGRHTFEVRARNAAGLVDATPAAKTFQVKKRKRRR
jgi:hypothetical protein